MQLHDILKRLLAKACLDASFMCLSGSVVFRVTFNDLCCWTQRCGLLSRLHLRVTEQNCLTGENESVLHFEVVFVVCWPRIGRLVQVVFYTVSLFCSNYTKNWCKFVELKTLKQIFQLENKPCVHYMIFQRGCSQNFVSMFQLCVCLDLFHFVSFLTINAAERNVVAYSHAYIYGWWTKVGTLVQMNLHYTSKLFL